MSSLIDDWLSFLHKGSRISNSVNSGHMLAGCWFHAQGARAANAHQSYGLFQAYKSAWQHGLSNAFYF